MSKWIDKKSNLRKKAERERERERTRKGKIGRLSEEPNSTEDFASKTFIPKQIASNFKRNPCT